MLCNLRYLSKKPEIVLPPYCFRDEWRCVCLFLGRCCYPRPKNQSLPSISRWMTKWWQFCLIRRRSFRSSSWSPSGLAERPKKQTNLHMRKNTVSTRTGENISLPIYKHFHAVDEKSNIFLSWNSPLSLTTVEIVYNDIGYNDEPDITTEWWPKVWPAMTIHVKKIGYNDASITTKPLITTQFWSFLIGYNDEKRRWRLNRALPSQTHIHRGGNSAMKEIEAYRNAAVYERYTKQSKLTDYFTHK